MDPHQEPIAIIAMAGVYPQAADLEAFWTNLCNGTRAFRWVAAERNGAAGTYAAFVELPEAELSRFRIPASHAPSIPPIHQVLIRLADQVFQEAGLTERPAPSGNRTDVICGTSFAPGRLSKNGLQIDAPAVVEELTRMAVRERPHLDAHQIAEEVRSAWDKCNRQLGGGAIDKLYEVAATIPAQIAVHLGLQGRTMCIDAAELTSYAALNVAVQSLRAGESDLALVACGQMLDNPLTVRSFFAKGLLCTEEDMAPFRRSGQGFLLGEGAGALLLKRLDDAVRDGDRIRAVIREVALSHSSERGSFRYARDPAGRAEGIRHAYRRAGLSPASVQFIECFEAAIPGETAQEIESLSAVFTQAAAPEGSIRVGSVKELIGHSLAAAGMASLTKLVMSLERKTILPQHHLSEAEQLELSGTPFRVSRELAPWPSGAGCEPRRAAINAAGLGGGHGHLILEEHLPSSPAVSIAPVERRSGARPCPLAIVGLGGIFSGARDAAQLWERIVEGYDGLQPLPRRTLNRETQFESRKLDPLKSYTCIGAPVEVPEVDPARFRLVPPRLAAMDNAQKLGLAAAAEALEGVALGGAATCRKIVVVASSLGLVTERRAGILCLLEELLESLRASPLFAELGTAAGERILSAVRAEAAKRYPAVGPFSLDGYMASGTALLISNALNLNAATMTVQAACASSMAALDVACQSLVSGERDLAVVGGVELGVNHYDLILCSRMRLLSPDRIKPFDAKADGFSLGEGAAFFALKRLDDARRDGDPIHAVIRAIGAANDAHSLIAPSVDGQALSMRRAFEKVDFSPDDVDYVEAHGTGTELGDPVEAGSIYQVYGSGHRDRPLVLGSIKSMVGHTMAAAGAAGLLKTVLALRAKTLPQNANLTQVNPRLELGRIPARVLTRAEPWLPGPSGVRRAAISAFGTGGIDYHMLIEEHRS